MVDLQISKQRKNKRNKLVIPVAMVPRNYEKVRDVILVYYIEELMIVLGVSCPFFFFNKNLKKKKTWTVKKACVPLCRQILVLRRTSTF